MKEQKTFHLLSTEEDCYPKSNNGLESVTWLTEGGGYVSNKCDALEGDGSLGIQHGRLWKLFLL